jgi:hypothetical protein
LVRSYLNSKEFKFEISEVWHTIQRRTLMRLLPVLDDSEPSREDQEGKIHD